MTRIVWFRNDLRTDDNPALIHAATQGPVIGVYVLEENLGADSTLGAAARWWLHHSLSALSSSLNGLILLRGSAVDQIPELVRQTGAKGVYWNRRYESDGIAVDTRLKEQLRQQGLDVASFNGSLLFEPWGVKTKSGGPYKVFSAYWRACLQREVLPGCDLRDIDAVGNPNFAADLAAWKLLPSQPDWAVGFQDVWQPGEREAADRLEQFLDNGLAGYGQLRDRPDLENTSRLSPHLHFGELSVRRLWHRLLRHVHEHSGAQRDADKFLSEIGWREFSHHLLFHFPTLPHQNLNTSFDSYPWQDQPELLRAWQRGLTGYPIVDAGMRELWRTGYMHNRVRMVAASFLTKHLRTHWRHGAEWFWDTLVDADQANNSAGWQWVAGCGADAAPYFRIFNPVTQGQKFDPDGTYVRRWCPELANLPNKFLHAPWTAPEAVLQAANVTLGTSYPAPVVDHATARQSALAGYEIVKTARN